MHELATTIGDYWLLAILSAAAAGLSATALMSGTARIKCGSLPSAFPADAEAQLEKYGLAFNQLRQAEKDNKGSLVERTEPLKHQPASHLCLKAFEHFTADQKRSDKK